MWFMSAARAAVYRYGECLHTSRGFTGREEAEIRSPGGDGIECWGLRAAKIKNYRFVFRLVPVFDRVAKDGEQTLGRQRPATPKDRTIRAVATYSIAAKKQVCTKTLSQTPAFCYVRYKMTCFSLLVCLYEVDQKVAFSHCPATSIIF